MPSFLNKVFGYKKHDDKEASRPTREPSDTTLLDGKYEAIPSVVSPTESTFAEAQQHREPDRDVGFSLFWPRTRGATQKLAQRRSEDVPHLTLKLPGPKDNSDARALGVVFEADPDSQIVLNDADIAAKRLNPLEALILVRACAQAITERGLETLGIMHPHWFSASLDVQRRLISLFIRSLTQSKITTLSPTSTSPTSAFENELHYTRSPHDVAAVLRWGLRHLSLENAHFGKDSTEWGWYSAFFDAERNGSYPPKGFSELLLPNLPTSHAELLTTTLNLIASLASHAEANSISGSKLSKFLGLWLLAASRGEQSDDWSQFYTRWERSGRILEHLFLARLRDESVKQRLPTRLLELVKHYPYDKGSPSMEADLLTRPRFSTRQYDALFIRIDTLLTHNAQQPKQHPVQLLLDAFQLSFDNPSGDEIIALWSTLKNAAFEDASSSCTGGPQFSRILVEETIHLLSSIPAGNGIPTSPTLLSTPITQPVSSEPSSSISQALDHALSRTTNGSHLSPISPTSSSSIVVADWAQFAMSGFGDTPNTQPLAPPVSPNDDDIEVTRPKTVRKSSLRRAKSRSRGRRSDDREHLETLPQPESGSPIVETRLASVHVVQIDEAFIDFWSDAIVDPISANWPTFVVCGLKRVASTQQNFRWLVIEQAYSRQESPPSRVPSPDGRRGRSPRPSFKSDISGFRINSVFASARKRFSVFNKSATDLDVKKAGAKMPMAGELGEVLVEEEPTHAGVRADGNGTVTATAIGGVVANLADQLKADQITAGTSADVLPTSVIKEESGPVEVAVKVPSVEPTPQSTGLNGSASVLSSLPVKSSEETVPAPRSVDIGSSKDNGSATPVTKILPLASATSGSQPIQGAFEPTILATPVSSIDKAVAQKVQIEDTTVQVENLSVEPIAQGTDRDVRLHTVGELSDAVQVRSADGHLREDTGAVTASPSPKVVALAAMAPAIAAVAAAVVVEAPELAVKEQREAEQPPQIASADLVTALSVESKEPGEIGDLPPVPAPEVVAAETGAQLEPLKTSLVNKVEEAKDVAKHAAISTSAPERVLLVEDTLGQEVSVHGHAGAAQISATKQEVPDDGAAPQLEVVDHAASQPVAAELQATLEAEGSSITQPVEAPCVVAAMAVDTSLEAVVVETKDAADKVSGPTAEQPRVELSNDIAPAVDVSVDVSDGHVSVGEVPAEVVAQAAPESFFHEERREGSQDTVTATPHIPEQPALDADPPGLTAVAAAHTLIQPALIASPDLEVETQDSGAVVEVIPLAEEAQRTFEAEPSAQVHGIPAAEVLSNEEATTAALATVVEVAAIKAEVLSGPDAPVDDGGASFTLEDVPVEDAVVVVVEASEPAPPTAAVEPEPVEDEVPAAPVGEETPLGVCDVAPNASEPVAITPILVSIPASTTDEPGAVEPSSESTAQLVDDASVVVEAVAEETVVAVVEVEVPEVVDPAAVEEVQVVAETEPTRDATLQDVDVVVIVSTKEPQAPAPVVDEDVTVPEEAEVAVEENELVTTEEPHVEDTVVIVSAENVEAPAVEPMVVEVIPAPVVEDMPAPEEAAIPTEITVVEVSELIPVDEPQAAAEVEPAPPVEDMVVEVIPVPVVEDMPAPEEAAVPTEITVVEVSELIPVDEPQAAAEVEPAPPVEDTVVVTEPEALATEPAVVEVVEDTPIVMAAEASTVEVSEPVLADEPQVVAVAEAEPAPEMIVAEVAAEPAAPTPIVEDVLIPVEAEAVEAPEPEETVVFVSAEEPEVLAAEPAVVDVPASVVEDAPVPEVVEISDEVVVQLVTVNDLPVTVDDLPIAEVELAPQVEGTVVVVSITDPEAPAEEPTVVEIMPIVEDIPAETEVPIVVEAAEPVGANEPETAPAAEATTEIDEPHQVVDHSERPVMVSADVPVKGTEAIAPPAP